MPNRVLRYAASALSLPLARNPQHGLAHDHAVSIFGGDAVYSMIPKNACSTLRLSIALHNGVIGDARDWHWIHQNNATFRPELRQLMGATYTFAVLRCPYARLVSCFLDKFVSRSPEAWAYRAMLDDEPNLARLSFRAFCAALASPRVKHGNIHWRPQVDFLVYRDYDDLFCVEDMGALEAALLSRLELALVDARPLVRHDASHYQMLPPSKSFADTEVWQIEGIMMSGLRPHPQSFYDDDLRALVEAAYVEDFRLYRMAFAGRGLFAAEEPRALAV